MNDVQPLSELISPATMLPNLSTHSLNPAQWMHERIVRSINEFEQGLDQDHEIGALNLVTPLPRQA